MGEGANRLRRLRRDERGAVSILETLLVAGLLAIVLGGTLSLLETTAEMAPKEQERAHAIRDAQVGLARMTRELRQASAVSTPPDPGDPPGAATAQGTMTATVIVGGAPTAVTYDCTAPSHSGPAGLRACVRRWTVSGQQRSELVIDRVKNHTSVFRRTRTNFVVARIEVPAGGELDDGLRHTIVLDDGFYLRNVR